MDLNPEELKNSFQSQAPGEDFDKYVSAATGLTILMATSVSGSQIKSSDRESLAKNLPDIVLINNYGKGESLHLGLAAPPQKVINDINNLHLDFTFNLEDVSCNDPFSFLSGWEVVPRADKLGMYSLIINLQLRNNSKNTEMIETKRKLVKLLNDFNISKTMHGDNEVMIQVMVNVALILIRWIELRMSGGYFGVFDMESNYPEFVHILASTNFRSNTKIYST